MFVILFGAAGELGKMFSQKFKNRDIKLLAIEKNDPEQKWKSKISLAQMIILAVPIEKTPALAKKIAPLLTKDQIFSDFTSIKNEVIPAMEKSAANIVSVHPMFGKLSNIQGQKIILLPVRTSNQKLQQTKKLYQSLGLDVYILKEWQKHDQYMSIIQALLHFCQLGFVDTLREQKLDMKTLFDICSPIYKINFSIACRILSRNPNLYSHILMDNPNNLEVLESFLLKIQKQIKIIKQNKNKQFVENFQKSSDFLKQDSKQLKKIEHLGNFLIQEVQKSKI
jgi:prephenate dehydrogenase